MAINRRSFLFSIGATAALSGKAKSLPNQPASIAAEIRRRKVPEVAPYIAFAVTGPSVRIGASDCLHLPKQSEVEHWHMPVHLTEPSDKGKYAWTLIPLRTPDIRFTEDRLDKLIVFKVPRRYGANYCMGVQVGYGLEDDPENWTAISVHEIGEGDAPDLQVASFTSARLTPSQVAQIAGAIRAFYEIYRKAEQPGVKFSIEQITGPGDTCQAQLKLMGFERFTRFTMYHPQRTEIPDSVKTGWYTTAWSKPILVENFASAVANGNLILNDPQTISESKEFVDARRNGSGPLATALIKKQHGSSFHAAAMAFAASHALDFSGGASL